jgi:hypothetical protein
MQLHAQKTKMAREGGDLASFLENSPFEGLVGFELIGSRRWDWNEQEAIEVIFGSIDPKGSIVKGIDDGIYLRLPPENDINNHPHFLLDSTHHIRHIFWHDGWKLAPESNSKFGSCMMSATADIEGKWVTMGESIEEDRARFQFIFQEADIPSKIYSYAQISTFCDDDGLYNKFGDFNAVYNNHLARHNTKRAPCN